MFDLDQQWQVHPRVALRPERFGALLYHFNTRKLSFLKNPTLLKIVQSLGEQPTARAALVAADVPAAQYDTYRAALNTLATSDMIVQTGK
ncbi:putative mycofactocin binding protein MftB [Antricoccus suffuscus]|uniref:Putative mycofactocin binding protein MftB n=1 Tax=Antricoccus suffuscus TaxID=1629062 RepID=A0A2T1A072_9ACTN|nr:mycofactocin biosynthesis chaperone MftB [Antricoccus suffuscus]PRZ42006.1 putative mycofactocin binding protein MftB [Antricoccus suffuscus]